MKRIGPKHDDGSVVSTSKAHHLGSNFEMSAALFEGLYIMCLDVFTERVFFHLLTALGLAEVEKAYDAFFPASKKLKKQPAQIYFLLYVHKPKFKIKVIFHKISHLFNFNLYNTHTEVEIITQYGYANFVYENGFNKFLMKRELNLNINSDKELIYEKYVNLIVGKID